jgi:hypothetical protein
MDIDIPALPRRRSERLARMERGDLVISPNLQPCRLKILMLVDGYPFISISFYRAPVFGLTAVLDTLRDNPEYFVKFDVTRAHRQIDMYKPDPETQPVDHELYGPHYENFRFDQSGFDINEYDQIWLFGFRSVFFQSQEDPDQLTDNELAILARWMDNGGGLFAAGDHADLGSSLASRLPRVRSMRKWTLGQVPPQPTGVNRHDSLEKGHDASYTFDDESDDTPMSIVLKYYPLSAWSPFTTQKAPHPLLSGSAGPIDILPDHPHEGEVIPESAIDVTQTFSFADYSAAEYPTLDGVHPTPEVIAWATVQADHTAASDHNKGPANYKLYGAVGAYNGHDADVGRVSVDSTWHHWFDLNLTGRMVENLDSPPFDSTNPKTLGFLATAAGRQAYARIQEYHRNTAIWLASESKQRCMFLRAIWGAVLRYPAVERLSLDLPIWELGQYIREVVGRRANQSILAEWLIDLCPPTAFNIFSEPGAQPDARLTLPPWEVVEVYSLGGITRELLRRAYELGSQREDMDEETLAQAFVEGAQAGMTELIQHMETSMDDTRGRIANLSDLMSEPRRSAGDFMS